MVYGHSVEEVDMDYFKEVNRSTTVGARWTFYCYDERKVSHFEEVALQMGLGDERFTIIIG